MSSGCGAGVHFLRSPPKGPRTCCSIYIYKPEEKLQAGVSTPSDLSDLPLSPLQRVQCPPSPALACCSARARWSAEVLVGHRRGSCSSPWGLCSSTSPQVISLPLLVTSTDSDFFSSALLLVPFHFIHTKRVKVSLFAWGLPCR
jgi:hypothetical protein